MPKKEKNKGYQEGHKDASEGKDKRGWARIPVLGPIVDGALPDGDWGKGYDKGQNEYKKSKK